MSKRHFEAFAKALKAAKPESTNTEDPHVQAYQADLREQWLVDLNAIAITCVEFSPRFDREKFLEACGI